MFARIALDAATNSMRLLGVLHAPHKGKFKITPTRRTA
jgi:hypothetical protein